jgi:hypothetical protein
VIWFELCSCALRTDASDQKAISAGGPEFEIGSNAAVALFNFGLRGEPYF